MSRLTKSDFIQFLKCPKSLWLQKRKPECYRAGPFTAFQKKLVREGYAVEREVQRLVASWPDADRYSSQWLFETEGGLFARADLVRTNEDGSLDLFEIKSSTRIKETAPDFQLRDATFQTIVAERCGFRVRRIQMVHLNGDYVRQGPINPSELLTFSDITSAVRDGMAETDREVELALDLLEQGTIDETACSCLFLGRSRHCDSFDHFNSDVPDPSIYDLPRVSQSKSFQSFVEEGRFSLADIALDELSPRQQLVLEAYRQGAPVIDHAIIGGFLDDLDYPLHFLDYEAFATAIPKLDGTRPHAQIPFQYSVHVLDADGALTHHDYLAEQVEMPGPMLMELSKAIEPTGSVISWHMSYENTRNREMADAFPEHAAFLGDMTERTVDLEDVFKTGYVDIAFRGSTSIKKVLPVLIPELSYDGLEIADGTAAMEGWLEMVGMPAGERRSARRTALLAYCEQDTLAMVRIFQLLMALSR